MHRQRYSGSSFNNTVVGNARFSPIFTPDGTVIPTLYAGESPRVALCEVIFHDLDLTSPCLSYHVAALDSFRHTRLTTAAALQLASLDLPSLVKMRAGKNSSIPTPANMGLPASGLRQSISSIRVFRE
ncbi:RES domain-containing protein [Erwinia aphidicola]|uniref:RES domain-containing protein n=1 Tax=Erwinia aphidicola TaxID=68334 RepID=UPI0030D0C77D